MAVTADDRLGQETARALAGGDRSRLGTKLPVRERLALLLDDGSFAEDGLLATACDEGLPADAVDHRDRAGSDGRTVAVIAHDPTVKAGSWGRRTVEKQVRLLESADRDLLPVFYLVDSAGGRLTDQLGFHPGPRGAARIFHLQVRLSGRVPQLCCLFGPSAAGGAYMPAFCDWVAMVDGNASMYLASPRIAEKAIGEIVTLEEMGGAQMHTQRLRAAPTSLRERRRGDRRRPGAVRLPARLLAGAPGAGRPRPAGRAATGPASSRTACARPTTSCGVVERVADAGSVFEIKARWARELVIGVRAHRRPAGRHRRQPAEGPLRRAAGRLRRQGRALHQPVRRVQRAARSSSPTCPGSWSARRSSARASSATARR